MRKPKMWEIDAVLAYVGIVAALMLLGWVKW